MNACRQLIAVALCAAVPSLLHAQYPAPIYVGNAMVDAGNAPAAPATEGAVAENALEASGGRQPGWLHSGPGGIFGVSYSNMAGPETQAPAYGVPCEEAAEEEACEPWRLFCQKECGWNVYGWVAGGIMANAHNPADHYNGPVTFPDRDWGQLNQFYSVLERTVDTGGCGWDWGGRVDFLYGSDYVFTMATGLELTDDGAPHWNIRDDGFNPEYGLAVPQMYLEVGYNDLSVKVGHLYTACGYEVVPVTGNFFYTHAYTMQYGEPFTHTGAMATYQYSETTKLLAGIFNGWDAFDRVNDTGAGHLGLAWDGGTGLTLSYNFIFSPNEPILLGPAAGTLTNRNISSLVIGYTFGADDQWQYVFQNDVGWQHDGNAFTPGMSAEWYGVNQYLFYTINDCWKWGNRFEWFRDDDGARVTGLRNPSNAIFGDSFAGHFYEVSTGLNYTPSSNLTVRPELRYDWFDGDPAFRTAAGPYVNGEEEEQFLFGVDVIYLW
jgi:hypothetical protein